MNYTVNISLPKNLADLAKREVKKGYYASLSELVRTALRKSLMKPEVPTFKMSKKAERIALQALKDYKEGKATKINSFKELED